MSILAASRQALETLEKFALDTGLFLISAFIRHALELPREDSCFPPVVLESVSRS